MVSHNLLLIFFNFYSSLEYETSIKKTQDLINKLEKVQVFQLMLLLPRECFRKDFLSQATSSLRVLYELLQTSRSLDFDEMLIENIKTVPDDEEQIYSQLKEVFKSADTE